MFSQSDIETTDADWSFRWDGRAGYLRHSWGQSMVELHLKLNFQ